MALVTSASVSTMPTSTTENRRKKMKLFEKNDTKIEVTVVCGAETDTVRCTARQKQR